PVPLTYFSSRRRATPPSTLFPYTTLFRTLCDQIGRAYGVLTYAHAMPSKEALNLLSIIKLGMDLGAFPEDQRLQVDELFIETQPAHLQKSSQQKLNAEERDHLRAQIIRD